MIGGMTTDQPDLCDAMYEGTSLYAEHGNWLMLFGVVTHPEVQHQGLASKLMRQVIEDTQKRGCLGIVLTCKEELLPFYASFGFVNEGVSVSVHGGAVWYQMRLDHSARLERCILQGEETHFYLHGRRVLLYGWEQCNGFVLNIAGAAGEILWQTAPQSREQWCCSVPRLYEKPITGSQFYALDKCQKVWYNLYRNTKGVFDMRKNCCCMENNFMRC